MHLDSTTGIVVDHYLLPVSERSPNTMAEEGDGGNLVLDAQASTGMSLSFPCSRVVEHLRRGDEKKLNDKKLWTHEQDPCKMKLT